MRLLSIHLKNLNSLKGEVFLSFEEAPLKNCGLFLITGSTGAGKSTILDAITLALFGEVPRFQDMGGNNKEQKIVTHGASDAFAEVTFESGEQAYRAKWSIGQFSRGKNKGNFQSSKRELVLLAENRESGQPISTKKSEVNAQVEQLLNGLNFKRFTRSVMLAQGDFAEFLKNVKDRAEILERITNSQRYSEISKAAYERHKLAEQELLKLKEQRDGFALLSEEEKATLRTERTQLETEEKAKGQQIKKQQQQLQQLQQLAKLEIEAQQIAKSQQQLAEELSTVQPQLSALQQHQKAAIYQPALAQLEELQTKDQQLQTDIEQLNTKVQQSNSALQNFQEQGTKIQQQLQQAETAYQLFDQNYTKVVALDSDIANQQKSLQELTQASQVLTNKIAQQKSRSKQLESAQTKAQNNQQQAQNWLQTHIHYAPLIASPLVEQLQSKQENWQAEQVLLTKAQAQQEQVRLQQQKTQENKTAQEQKLHQAQTDWEAAKEAYRQICLRENLDAEQPHEEHLQIVRRCYEDLDGLLEVLRQIEEERKTHQRFLQESFLQEEEITGQQVALEQLDTAFLVNEGQLKQAKQERQYYTEVHQAQQQRNSLSEHRGALQEGEPCPLCFSEEQPFRQMNVDVGFALRKAATDLKTAESNYEAFYKNDRTIIEKQRSTFSLLQKAQEKKNLLQQKIEQTEGQISRLLEQYPIPSGLVIHQKQALEKHIGETNSSIKKYQQLENELKDWQRRAQTQTAAKKSLQEQLQLLGQNSSAEKARADELALDIQQYQSRREALKEAINAALKPFQLSLSDKDALKKLTAYRKNYHEQQEAFDLQKNEIEKLQNDLTNAQERTSDWQQELNEQQQSLNDKKTQVEALKTQRLALFKGESVEAAKQEHLEKLDQLRQTQTALQQQINQQQKEKADLEGRNKALQEHLTEVKAVIQQKKQDLIAQLATAGLGDLSTLRALLLDEAQATKYQQLQEELQQRQQRLNQQAADNQKALAAQQDLLKTVTHTAEELQASLTDLEQLRTEQLQELGALKEKLEQQALQQKQHEQLLANIDQHQKEVLRWNTLNNLVGSASGNKFRRFAQSITLKKLVRLANVHLSTFLNQRYYLEMRLESTENTKDTELLEIDIVDTFQLNNKRPLNTLSGGESFLASLALALALSDLASGNTNIESLFIDEGFGTLDSNTLQMAIRALQTLEQQGKIVGIISHVEKLKQSIDTQILVEKKGGGYSSVSVK